MSDFNHGNKPWYAEAIHKLAIEMPITLIAFGLLWLLAVEVKQEIRSLSYELHNLRIVIETMPTKIK